MPQSLSMYSRVTSTGNGLGLWTRNCTRSPSNNLTPGAGQAMGWPCLSVLSLSRRISRVTFTPASVDSSAWLRARSAEGSVASFFRFWTRAMRPRRSSRVALSFSSSAYGPKSGGNGWPAAGSRQTGRGHQVDLAVLHAQQPVGLAGLGHGGQDRPLPARQPGQLGALRLRSASGTGSPRLSSGSTATLTFMSP